MCRHSLFLSLAICALVSCDREAPESPIAPTPQALPLATLQTGPTRIIRFGGNIDFGDVEIGSAVWKRFSVCNDGNTSLYISGIVVTGGYWLSFDDWEGTQIVPAGSCRDGTIAFEPFTLGSYPGTATAMSDSTSGTSTFQISGAGRRPPQPRTSFGEGRYLVGVGIAPGRYYSDPSGECYWTRTSTHGDAVAWMSSSFDPDQWVVDILPTDALFENYGCGSWSQTPFRVRDSRVIRPGMWDVRAQVPKGRYRADAQAGCFWQRLRSFEGTPDGVIEAGSADRSMPITVSIQKGDAGFYAGAACGRWYWNE